MGEIQPQHSRSELRFTETNSGDDSTGRTWGLDGNLFWFVIGGVFSFVVLLLWLFSSQRMGFGQSLAIAAVPLVLSLTYVFALRQGKPPAYDIDLLDCLVSGRAFAPEPISNQPRNPLRETESNDAQDTL